MHVVMTGATGFLGRALAMALLEQGCELSVYSRDPAKARRKLGGQVAAFSAWHDAPTQADAVINLAGEPLIGGRWTARKKDRMRASRIGTTHGLVQWMSRMQLRPDVLISGSAVGYYGYSSDQVFNEHDAAGSDFGARLCADWETSARAAEALNVRVCIVRTGVVLHRSGGALKRMLPAFKLGLGGPIASGQQWFSWIHLHDWLSAVLFLLSKNDLSGVFNLTAPQPQRNADFSQALATALGKPCALRVPAFVVKMMAGEGAELLLNGQNVMPNRLLENGFVFSRPDLAHALADVRGS
ncbi:TIGR01777 family protein [Permianibacter sp. IMCC34836]|uniref:TIGR01777 family oxidoreductase n=1 Tax=Permianibacter fluminis TaxID=2738515 RepID=UPI0015579986|nr:TIGR01777 family oxidoreductase [Permianibacter fluminis]NQD37670.1 TIGR01777 family protein [Permianibacter fluminis]